LGDKKQYFLEVRAKIPLENNNKMHPVLKINLRAQDHL
jgi:hypothetical protein